MKLSDFRIGNLMMQHGEVVPIYQLDTGGTTFWRINDLCIHKETFREKNSHNIEFEPIPLTEIWLDKYCKFLFQKSGFGSSNLWQIKIPGMHKHFGVYEIPPLREDKNDPAVWSIYNNQYDVKILYVHQLQNLFFFLTGGIELIIENYGDIKSNH